MRFIKRTEFSIIFMIILANFVFAYPKPINYVSDYANLISEQKENELNNLLKEFEKKNSVEIAVLTVNNLEGITIERYAVEIFEEWGIGKRDVDNGLLIVVALKEREYRVEVGYGLESVLPDALAGRIARENFVPNFKEEKYSEGIYDAVLEFMKVIEKDPSVISKYSTKNEEPFLAYIILSIALIFITNLILRKVKKSNLTTRIVVIILFAGVLSYYSVVLGIIYTFLNIIFSSVGKGRFRGGIRGWSSGSRNRGFGFGGGGSSGGGGASGKW